MLPPACNVIALRARSAFASAANRVSSSLSGAKLGHCEHFRCWFQDVSSNKRIHLPNLVMFSNLSG